LIIAYLLEGTQLSLLGACFTLVLMVWLFPLRSQVENWIQQQRELIDQARLAEI
jgi:hypothetical protein